MRIKKALIFLIILALVVMPSFADESVWRLWFNDEVIYLSVQQMPIVEGNTLYLPATEILKQFGATYVYDSQTSTYTLFRNDLILAFNMRTNQVITSDERFLFARVFYQNNVFYLPAEFTLNEFGGRVSTLASGSIRIVTGRQRLSNAEIEAVEATMTSYEQSEISSSAMYLVIRALPGQVDAHLRQLQASGVKAAFFFTAADILANPDALRAVYVDGHTIGLYVSGQAGTTNAVESLDRARFIMERVIKTSTNIVLAPGGSYNFYSELSDAGYVAWDTNFDTAVEANGVSLSTVAGRIRWRSAAYFDGTAASAARLGRLLDTAAGLRTRIATVDEAARPLRYGQ